ncbi:MAG: hypothetical protein COA38_01030 [Fluviicola sp.]|nr:MAG: hypothetical protein COA38_01030 [Fluviicola sp.]
MRINLFYMKETLLLLFVGMSLTATSQCINSVTVADSTICVGDSVILTATGPGSPLTTTLSGGNNHRGNMFDIVALNAVTIQSFDAHPIGNTGYEIYYKVGGYAGSESTPTDWTLVGSVANVIAQPLGTATPIPIPVNIVIPAGQTYAFYVTSTNIAVSQNYSDGSVVGAVFASDVNIQFLEGAGMEYPFTAGGSFFSPRVWNGIIHYEIGTTYLWDTGATTPEITVAPTIQTTYLVDITSNGCPTATDSVTIYMSPDPVIDLGLDTNVCAGDALILDAGIQSSYSWNNGASTNQFFMVTTASTNFVAVTNSEGCTKSDTIQVVVSPVPVVDLGADTTICEGIAVTLDAGNAGSTFDWSTTETTQTIDVGGGNYSVDVTNPEGCTESSSITISENPAPIVDLGNDTTFCLYGTTVLDAGTGFSDYLWSTTETTQTIIVDGTTLGAGAYTFTVDVTDSLGCTTTESVVVTVDPCAGIDTDEISHMKVYPNPTSNVLNVNIDQLTSDGQLTIYSMDGVKVLSEKLTSNSQEVDLTHLANGSYILELKTADYSEIIKVIKN